jgi:hypothetical protein
MGGEIRAVRGEHDAARCFMRLAERELGHERGHLHAIYHTPPRKRTPVRPVTLRVPAKDNRSRGSVHKLNNAVVRNQYQVGNCFAFEHGASRHHEASIFQAPRHA